MRFNPLRIRDVGAVTCPPYDVMDRAMIDQLLDAHPCNVVRLILPRLVNEPSGPDDPYVAAAKRLARWRRREILTTDAVPALYVYEYGDPARPVRGLIGTLDLRRRQRGVVMPHEGVIPAIVADRLAMVDASDAELEPILLVYDGSRRSSDAIDEVCRLTPQIDVVADDATVHRLWAVTDDAQIARITAGLAGHRALIADGHHRFAMYEQLRRKRRAQWLRARGKGNRTGLAQTADGPWDYGLALLVDQSRHPIQVGAIHRSLSEMSLDDLTWPSTARVLSDVTSTPEPPRPPGEPGVLVVTDGSRVLTVDLGRELATEDDLPLVPDVVVLHDRLLPSWGVSEDRVGYHHTVEQALHHAGQEGGLSILLAPTTVAAVMAVAGAGGTLPRKSTSFGPKPRAGLVMRAFADEAQPAPR